MKESGRSQRLGGSALIPVMMVVGLVLAVPRDVVAQQTAQASVLTNGDWSSPLMSRGQSYEARVFAQNGSGTSAQLRDLSARLIGTLTVTLACGTTPFPCGQPVPGTFSSVTCTIDPAFSSGI